MSSDKHTPQTPAGELETQLAPETQLAKAPREHTPLIELLMIAAPSVVTMTSYTVMQFVDGLMVSRIDPPSPVYVAAQGNGGILMWTAASFGLGLASLINTFASQNLGAGKPERGATYAWQGFYLAALYAILLIPVAIYTPQIFAAMKPAGALASDPEVARQVVIEAAYARILLGGTFLLMASRALHNYFFGLHKPMVVMVAAIAGNAVNVVANAVLIFGEAGPPADTPLAGVFKSIAVALHVAPQGVSGAAWGTVIGTVVELVIPMAMFLSGPMRRAYGTLTGWRPAMQPAVDLLRVGWPAGLMFANEIICWSMLMTVLVPRAAAAAGRDVVIANSASWIALRYMHLSFMPAVGLSIAVAAVVGKCIGMKRPDLAAKRAWLGLAVTMTYMGLCALGMVIFPEPLVRVFVDPEKFDPAQVAAVVRTGTHILYAAAVFQLFDAMAITTSGALRGAGDTVYPGVATVVLSWTCIVGGGMAVIALAPGLGVIGPWIAASLYIVLLGVALMVRFVSGAWKHRRVVHDEDEGTGPGGEPAAVTPHPHGETPEEAMIGSV